MSASLRLMRRRPHPPFPRKPVRSAAPCSGCLRHRRRTARHRCSRRSTTHTAVYDIEAHIVYLPNGERMEAHSGLGEWIDDPGHVNVKSKGATPPNVYNLTMREGLFHGVEALRLTPVGGDNSMYGRAGILAHPYMLGPSGQSFGCVSFRDYQAFLQRLQERPGQPPRGRAAYRRAAAVDRQPGQLAGTTLSIDFSRYGDGRQSVEPRFRAIQVTDRMAGGQCRTEDVWRGPVVRCPGILLDCRCNWSHPSTHYQTELEGRLMARDVAHDWMWSEACETLARAERMHRELFRPVAHTGPVAGKVGSLGAARRYFGN